MTIIGALDNVFQRYKIARCLTGGIGLNVGIPSLKVKCRYCEKYADVSKILEGIDPTNKAKKRIIYYCENCKNTYEYEERNSATP